MKLALLVSFYDESSIVKQTISALKTYSEDSVVVCVNSSFRNSNKEDLEWIEAHSNTFITLPDVAGNYHKYEVPSVVVCRNYSRAFREFRKLNIDVDLIIVILGDTLIYDFGRLVSYLNDKLSDKKAGVLQAIGQTFHSRDANPIEGRCGGRPQVDGITDIMPQFFVLRGDIGGFEDIKNTNRFTSEENLGNELAKHVDFNRDVVRLNAVGAYSFYEGVKLQVKGLGHTRR